MTTAIELSFPPHFHFEHTVFSHGWCALFPFSVRRTPLRLSRTVTLPSGSIAEMHFDRTPRGRCRASVHSPDRLSRRDGTHAHAAAEQMLHFALDLRPFYRHIRGDAAFSWIARRRAGRMLRAPTFFEDAVKMILTTNCSWALTTQMNARLIAAFSAADPPHGHGLRDFPPPDAIAGSSESFLRSEVKLGYRAPFVLALSRRVAQGKLDIESFRTADIPAQELLRELRAIKGIGSYAAGNLLKLLGRFDYLGLDSWCRAKFAQKYNGGTPVDDRRIEAFYAPYEEWKGLVMWMDVTRHWYDDKFPF